MSDGYAVTWLCPIGLRPIPIGLTGRHNILPTATPLGRPVCHRIGPPVQDPFEQRRLVDRPGRDAQPAGAHRTQNRRLLSVGTAATNSRPMDAGAHPRRVPGVAIMRGT
jgi:hypothetical protein